MRRLRTLADILVTVLVVAAAVSVLRRSASTPNAHSAANLPLPTAPIALSDAFTLGEPTARVGLIEFGDFECPFCRQFEESTLPTIRRQFVDSGDVLFAFVPQPLEIHPHAKMAARLARCAGQQGRFWQVQELLFKRVSQLQDPETTMLFAQNGVNVSSLSTCLSSSLPATEGDADKLQIQGTPTFFVGRLTGGSIIALKRIQGAKDVSVFSKAIEDVLRATRGAAN